MDPDEALRQIRALIAQMQVEDSPSSMGARPEFVQHARDLAETVEGLDGWMTRGGFPPAEWLPGARASRPDKEKMT